MLPQSNTAPPEAPEKGAKYQPFFVLNTTHPFGHFRFTDFREIWQEGLQTFGRQDVWATDFFR